MTRKFVIIYAILGVPFATVAGEQTFGNNSLMQFSDSLPMNFHHYFSPPGITNPNWQNYGTISVIACGYDAMGIWRVVPLKVKYRYTNPQYRAIVLSAWNPWTKQWESDLNIPAVNTHFSINNTNYDFYVVVSTGTYYFNL